MEAKTKNTKLNDDDLFTIVGADYQIHTPVLKKPNLWSVPATTTKKVS